MPSTSTPVIQCIGGCEADIVSASDQYKVKGVQSWVGVAQLTGNTCTGTDTAYTGGAISSVAKTGASTGGGNAVIVPAPPDCSAGQAPVALPTGWMSCKNPDAAGKAAALAAEVAKNTFDQNLTAVADAAGAAASAVGGSASDVAAAKTKAAADYAAQQAAKDAAQNTQPAVQAGKAGSSPVVDGSWYQKQFPAGVQGVLSSNFTAMKCTHVGDLQTLTADERAKKIRMFSG